MSVYSGHIPACRKRGYPCVWGRWCAVRPNGNFVLGNSYARAPPLMASTENSVIVRGTGELGPGPVEIPIVDSMERRRQRQQQAAQIVADTPDVSYATVPVEVLEAAGIDIDNPGDLTEEQMSTIMSLIGTNEVQPVTVKHPDEQHRSTYPADNIPPSISSSAVPETADRLTLYVLDDGSLKLIDAALQKEYFFTSDELALQNIDVDNLTDESLQRVIQLAMECNDLMDSKRRRLDDEDADATVSPKSTIAPVTVFTSTAMEQPATLASPKKTPPTEEHRTESHLSLIGTEVEVKRDGRIFSATIRYCRQSGGYKVQFSDGHFEWVSADEIRLLEGENAKKRGDHESYSETVETTVAGGTTTKNINSRKCVSQIPGIKVMPADGYHKKEEIPNFCCAVCDRKVYQQEPQYIVIRIPACDKCTEEKMIILDDSTKDCETQTGSFGGAENDVHTAPTSAPTDENGKS